MPTTRFKYQNSTRSLIGQVNEFLFTNAGGQRFVEWGSIRIVGGKTQHKDNVIFKTLRGTFLDLVTGCLINGLSTASFHQDRFEVNINSHTTLVCL